MLSFGLGAFAYTLLVALAVYFVVLPIFLPQFRDPSDGLLLKGDWHRFHQLAVELATRIHSQGWSAWQLRPEGQAPAGIAAALYAIFTPQAWVMLPVNAAVHAFSAVLLARLIVTCGVRRREAILATLPFLLFPSPMLWYTQIHKDGWFCLGLFLFLNGICSILRPSLRRLALYQYIAVIEFWSGALVMWVIRPYVNRIFILLALGGLIPVLVIHLVRRIPLQSWSGPALLIALTLSLTPLPPAPVESDLMSAEITPAETASGNSSLQRPNADHRTWLEFHWTESDWLPTSADSRLKAVAAQRIKYLTDARNSRAHSTIDAEVPLQNAGQVLAYLPRAVVIACFYPNITQWSALSGGPLFSRLLFLEVILETLVATVCLLALLWALFRQGWTRRWSLNPLLLLTLVWMSLGLAAIFSVSTPNLGTLARVRYGPIMILVALGMSILLGATRKPGSTFHAQIL